MKKELLSWICCPQCGSDLHLFSFTQEEGEIKEGKLKCSCGKTYFIKESIPRFVESDTYAGSFSFEWEKHRRTQLDSANAATLMKDISKEQFQGRVDVPLPSLRDKLLLDVGCGMGRYAEVAAAHSAAVICMDLSYAVDCCYKNLKHFKNVYFVQADVFSLPFKKNIFDFVYSFGVLHHTPDCEKAFKNLPAVLKQGGKLSIFVYSAYNRAIVFSSNFWRFFTTRLPKRILYYFSFVSVMLYYLYKIPVAGNIGKSLFVIPMWPDWRWRVLDTFDWYSPKYQSKHTHWEVFSWFKNSGFSDIKIYPDEITMSGTKT